MRTLEELTITKIKLRQCMERYNELSKREVDLYNKAHDELCGTMDAYSLSLILNCDNPIAELESQGRTINTILNGAE